MLAGLEQIERLEKHSAESLQIAENRPVFLIIAQRQLGGIVERPIQVELKSDLNDLAPSRLDVKWVMVETDLVLHDHVAKSLLSRKGLVKIQLHRPRFTSVHGPPPP